jgi:hypothetical protein
MEIREGNGETRQQPCDLKRSLPSTVYARVNRASERGEARFYVEALAFLTGDQGTLQGSRVNEQQA